MSVKKKSVFLFFLRAVKALVSVVTLSLSAKYFGVTIARDTWIMAYTFLVTFDMMFWGPVNETFRTKFIQLNEIEGKQNAILKTNTLFIFTNFFTIVLFILLFLLAPIAAKILLPKSTPEDFTLLVNMIHILAPSLLFNQVNNLMTGILNAYNIFFVPEISGLISSILNILVIVFCVPYFGIYSLAVGYYISLLLLFFLLIYNIKKSSVPLLKGKIEVKWDNVKVFLLFALPYYAPYFFGQINGIAEKSIASMVGKSSISILDYARKIVEMPSNVITGVLATMLVPILSKNFINNNRGEYNKHFIEFFQLGILFFTFFIVLLVFCSHDLTNFLYNKGSISALDLKKIEDLTIGYAVSFISIFLYQLFSFVLLSSNQGKLAALLGILPQVFMVACNFSLFRIIGVWTFPISLFLGHIFSSIVFYFKYPYNLKGYKKNMLKYCFFLVTVIIFSFGINFILSPYMAYNLYINLSLEILLSFIILMVSSFLFKIDELQNFKNLIYKKIK